LRPPGRLCIVTDSADIIRRRQPQSVYFPETIAVELRRYPDISELKLAMEVTGFESITEETVEFAYELSDLQAYRDKVFSSLLLISEEEFERGLARMQADLQRGPICGVSRYSMIWGRKPSIAG
jgi:hypothetical protein